MSRMVFRLSHFFGDLFAHPFQRDSAIFSPRGQSRQGGERLRRARHHLVARRGGSLAFRINRGQHIGFGECSIAADNFGGVIQHQLAGQTLAEIGYIANVGHRLNGPSTSVNQVRPELMGAGNAQARRPFPQFGNVVSQTPFWGNSSYHSLNLKLEKRFSKGLNFLTNYTFSKFIDDVPSGFENGNVPGGIQDFYNRQAERSLSGNDVRHRLVTSGVYELPMGQGRKYLTKGPANWIAGGWNLGVIMTLQAGSPNSAITQANTTNAFNPGAQRANLVGNPNLPASERTPARWFNTGAFAQPALFTFGNVSRAAFTGPGVQNFDLSLLKNFPFQERLNLQFRFESFNILNKANFDDPNTTLGSPGFGTLAAARGARSIQFGLRLSF